MKKLLLAFVMLFFISCGNKEYSFKPVPLYSQAEALQYKQKIIESGTFIDYGVNMMYAYGFYIWALSVHGILTADDAQQWCDRMDKLYLPTNDGLRSHWYVDWDRIMTRDDYLPTWLASVVGERVNSCATKHKNFMFNQMNRLGGLKLEKDVWSPTHHSCFNRVFIKDNYHIIDYVNYIASTKPIADKPENDTSDKLLAQACMIISRYHNPSSWSRASDFYFHSKVDFNKTLDIYWHGHPLGELLKGTL